MILLGFVGVFVAGILVGFAGTYTSTQRRVKNAIAESKRLEHVAHHAFTQGYNAGTKYDPLSGPKNSDHYFNGGK